MQDSLQVPKTLHFTSFRYINLIYSIPLTFLLIFGFAKICFFLEPIFQRRFSGWVSAIIYIFSLIIFTGLVIKVFFMLNLRRISLYIDDEGFVINNKETSKKYWSKVKSYTFPKDRYESRSNEAASIVMLSFGFMKMSIINCSTWTLFSRTRREEEKEAFAQFKQAVVHFC